MPTPQANSAQAGNTESAPFDPALLRARPLADLGRAVNDLDTQIHRAEGELGVLRARRNALLLVYMVRLRDEAPGGSLVVEGIVHTPHADGRGLARTRLPSAGIGGGS